MGRRQRKAQLAPLTIALIAGAALPVHACFNEAAERYQVSSTLLHAIARTESGLDPRAVGHNTNGSRDIGLMQINSSWLTTLTRYGIGEQDLYEPCTNIHVGAWILAQNIARYGYTWEAVGAYNAASPHLRARYIEKVRRSLASLVPSTKPTGLVKTISPAAHRELKPTVPQAK
jgi:soluble lytic murein transglycosylase-like protein